MNVHMKAPSQPGDAGFFWPTVGRPGRVPLWALAPDPEQPRKHFDPDELHALAETMKPGEGEQREIATVRDLTEEEMDSGRFAQARYLIKSGERRWRAAQIAGLTDLEIRVKEYATKGDEMLDTWMLNGYRVGLSDIEDAYAIANIAREKRWVTQTEIADGIHRDQVWVSQRLALLKTTPAVQARLFPGEKQLTLLTGILFSRLAADKQDEYIATMPPDCKTGSSQMNWVMRRIREDDVQLMTRTRQPSRMREILTNVLRAVDTRLETLMLAEDFQNLFVNATSEQRTILIGHVQKTIESFQNFARHVESLTSRTDMLELKTQPRQSPARNVDAAPPPPRQAPKAVEVRTPPVYRAPTAPARYEPPVRQPATLPAPRPKDPGTVQVTGTRASAPAVVRSGRPEWKNGTVKVKRWYEGPKEFRIDIPDLRDYIKLWDEGALEFQRTGASKPDDIPHRDEVAEFLGLDDE